MLFLEGIRNEFYAIWKIFSRHISIVTECKARLQVSMPSPSIYYSCMAGWHAVNFVKSNSERSFTDNNECVKQGNQSIISKHASVQTSWFVLQLHGCDGYPSLLDASYFLYWLSEPNLQQRIWTITAKLWFCCFGAVVMARKQSHHIEFCTAFFEYFLRESLVQDATFFISVYNSAAQNSSLTWLWNKIMR